MRVIETRPSLRVETDRRRCSYAAGGMTRGSEIRLGVTVPSPLADQVATP
jgi:hypothetical protein